MAVGNIKQVLNDFNNGTYNLTCNGKCTQCGECCSNILPMTDEEIEIIRKYIKKNNIKEHNYRFPFANPVIDATCPFLDGSKDCEKCRIYEVRPKICRDFSCDPQQRPPIDMKWGLMCKPVNVREVFFR